MTEYQLSSDTDLKEVVRALTLYDDTEDELPASTLDTQVRAAKIKLSTKLDTDPTDWYSDSGLSTALLGATLILSKCAVENYSITRWDVGGQYIDVSGNGDTDTPQLNEWNTLIADGLADAGSHSSQVPSFTKTYIGN